MITHSSQSVVRLARGSLVAALAFGLSGFAVGLKADIYTWDPSGTDGVQSGSGTWNTTVGNTVWTTDDGATHAPWANGANSVVFAGDDTGGTISLSTNITVSTSGNSISFLNSGYTLQSDSATVRIIAMNNSTPLLVASGKSMAIGSKVNFVTGVIGAAGTDSGTIIVGSGGALSSPGNSIISVFGNGTGVEVAEGGAFAAQGTIVLGNNTNDHVTLVVNGGDVSTTANTGNLALVNSSSGVTNASVAATLNSGTITLGGTSGRVVMGNANSNTVQTTFNLNGGTLTVRGVTDTNTAVSTFNFNGGTLNAITGADAIFVSSTINNAIVKAGGAKVDSNDNDLTIAAALSHDSTLDGTLDGGFEKLGAGTLTLTGANTYTGATTVTAGGLATAATGTFGSGDITLAAGTSLTLGNATSIADTALLVFDSTSVVNLSFVGQETLGGLQLAAGSSIGAGTYDADDLNGIFGGNVFNGAGELTILAAIPEPSTWALCAGAGALLGALVRRRSRRKIQL